MDCGCCLGFWFSDFGVCRALRLLGWVGLYCALCEIDAIHISGVWLLWVCFGLVVFCYCVDSGGLVIVWLRYFGFFWWGFLVFSGVSGLWVCLGVWGFTWFGVIYILQNLVVGVFNGCRVLDFGGGSGKL